MSPISNASRLAEFGTGIGTAGAIIQVDNLNQRVGIGTTNPQATLQVGTGITMYADAGIISATTYSGNWGGAFNGTTATFSGAVNIDATTDSTSSSTGALIVDGGVGIAKNVYIGAGLSVAGTLTYEDVTNVDSVGLITAKSGVNITGGELTVGSGITMGIAGVATFSGTADVNLRNNVKLLVGDSGDLEIFHDGSHSNITNSGTGRLYLNASQINLHNQAASENMLKAVEDGAVTLYYDSNSKFETTNDGTVTTGISTADGFSLGDSETLTLGASNDAELYHNDTNFYLDNNKGDIYIRNDGSNDDSDVHIQAKNGEESIVCRDDGAVEIYYDGGKTLETTANGVTIYDDGKDDEARLIVQGGEGSAATLYLYSDDGDDNADKWRLLNENTGEFKIQNYSSGSWETNFKGVGDGASVLYYNNSAKIETTNDGTVTTGICTATDFSGLVGAAASFPNGIIVNNTKTVAFLGAGADAGATIKHQSGHFEINNDTGNVYFDSAGNILLRTNGSTTALTVDNGQNATFAGNVTTGPVFTVQGTEGVSANLYLIADDGDDNGDGWRINSNQDDNDLTISNNTSGSYVDKLTLLTSGNATFTGSVSDSKGDLRQIIYQNKTSGYTLVAADAGKAIHISTGGVTINNSLFSAGDAVSIINNSGSDQTITQGSGVTLYNTSDGSTGNKTLSGRGMATVWFSSASVGYISGNI